MERKKHILIILFFVTALSASSQHNEKIYTAYTYGDMKLWKNTMDQFRPITNNEKLELINYYYGYIAYCIDQKERNAAKAYIQKTEKLITELEKQKYMSSRTDAYRSALVGFNIGLYPYKAPFIGPESLTYAEKSVASDSTNYMGYIQLANIAFYTPAMFGGSKPEALVYYLKALNIMEMNETGIVNNWNYLNLLATLINAYYEIEEFEVAKKYCIKTLAIEPHFDWVKNELYPNILKAQKDE